MPKPARTNPVHSSAHAETSAASGLCLRWVHSAIGCTEAQWRGKGSRHWCFFHSPSASEEQSAVSVFKVCQPHSDSMRFCNFLKCQVALNWAVHKKDIIWISENLHPVEIIIQWKCMYSSLPKMFLPYFHCSVSCAQVLGGDKAVRVKVAVPAVTEGNSKLCGV